MKKLTIMLVLVISGIMYHTADAQTTININRSIQPEWGPAGYDHAEYYYLPDIDVYYNISNRTYTYNERNRWITRTTLPPRYSHYNLYKSYKVVINDRQPWNRHQEIRNRYAMYKGQYNQPNIRDSHYTADQRGNKRSNEWNNGRRTVSGPRGRF